MERSFRQARKKKMLEVIPVGNAYPIFININISVIEFKFTVVNIVQKIDQRICTVLVAEKGLRSVELSLCSYL